jgi:hypothetical protein
MRRSTGGFSLTELMVAAALLATATAGGLQAFGNAQHSRREAGITQQLHERAQYTFATLEPELQMAGYFAGVGPGHLARGDIPDGAAQCGSELIAELNVPVAVLQRWTLTCEARDSDALPESDVLIVRRVSARLAGSPERGRAQWLSDASEPASGRLFWQGEAPWSAVDVARGHELRDLIVRVYYVAGRADGNDDMPALRVKSLTSIAGQPAFIDTEVMPGVEAMEVELVPASAAPAAVQVTLRVRADPTGASDAATPRTLQITRHFALRNVAG